MMLRPAVAFTLLFFFSLSAQEPAPGDVKSRLKAARELAKQDSSAIAQLTPMLSDQDSEVRIEAVKSITEIGTQRSIDPLISATRDNDAEVQIRAVDGIVNFYLPGYVPTGFSRLTSSIKGRFQKENDQIVEPYVKVREDAILAIGKLVRGGASMESRANAARALGILRGNAAVPDLLEALRSKDDAVLFESLIALQKIRDQSTGPRVISLMNDLQERVQIAAIETAGLLQTREAIPELRRIFDKSKSERVRRSALTSLAMLPDNSSRPIYQKGFADKSDGIRAAAAEGFGRLKSKDDESMISSTFAEEKKMFPRLAQAFALVNLGNASTGEFAPLTYLVNTLNSRQYKGVAQAYLNELARQPAVRAAMSDLLQGTRDEKIGLARALAGSGDMDVIGKLEPLTKDPDSEVAQESMRAVRGLKARLP